MKKLFITFASIMFFVSSASAVRYSSAEFLSPDDPESKEGRYIATYELHYLNGMGEEDHGKIKKLSGSMIVGDDDGFFSLVWLTTLLQEMMAIKASEVTSREVYYECAKKELIPHWEGVKLFLDRSLCTLHQKLPDYSFWSQDCREWLEHLSLVIKEHQQDGLTYGQYFNSFGSFIGKYYLNKTWHHINYLYKGDPMGGQNFIYDTWNADNQGSINPLGILQMGYGDYNFSSLNKVPCDDSPVANPDQRVNFSGQFEEILQSLSPKLAVLENYVKN